MVQWASCIYISWSVTHIHVFTSVDHHAHSYIFISWSITHIHVFTSVDQSHIFMSLNQSARKNSPCLQEGFLLPPIVVKWCSGVQLFLQNQNVPVSKEPIISCYVHSNNTVYMWHFITQVLCSLLYSGIAKPRPTQAWVWASVSGKQLNIVFS